MMSCDTAEEMIMENLEAPLTSEQHQLLKQHLSGCVKCRHFQQIQLSIDHSLADFYATLPLATKPNNEIARNIRTDLRFALWEAMPDILHLSSGFLITAGCIWLLPFSSLPLLTTGLGLTIVSYILHILFRFYLEEMESF